MGRFLIGDGAEGKTTSDVRVIKKDPNGKYLIGGRFNTWDNQTHHSLLRVFDTGEIDNSFDIGTGFDTADDIGVNDLTFDSDGNIYVVGNFTTFDGVQAYGIVALADDGSRYSGFTYGGVTGSTQGFSSYMRNCTRIMFNAYNDKLYIAGDNGYYNGTSYNTFLSLNLDGSVYNGYTGYDDVKAIGDAFSDGQFYIGGTFSTGLLRMNANCSVDATFTHSPGIAGGSLTDLCNSQVYNKHVWICGSYTSWNGSNSKYVSLIQSGSSLYSGPGHIGETTLFNSAPQCITTDCSDQNNIYVGGSFTQEQNNTYQASGVSKFVNGGWAAPYYGKVVPMPPRRVFSPQNGCDFVFYVGEFVRYDYPLYTQNSRKGLIVLDSDMELLDSTIYAPTGLTATGITCTTISLSWVKNENEFNFSNVVQRYSGSTWVNIATLSSGATSYTITGLTVDTSYTLRVSAKYNDVYYPSNQITESTSEGATISTSTTVSGITTTTANGGGNVTDDGGVTITERGLCWSTSTGSTIAGSHLSTSGTTGVFRVTMTGLTTGRHYYCRAYAINACGIFYGADQIFYTTFVPPVLSGSVISNYVHLTWTDVNFEAEHYQVWRLEGNGFPKKTLLRSYLTFNETSRPFINSITSSYDDRYGYLYTYTGVPDANGKINGSYFHNTTRSQSYTTWLGAYGSTAEMCIQPYDSFSINCWVKRTSTGIDAIASCQRGDYATNPYNGWALFFDATNKLRFQIVNTETSAHPYSAYDVQSNIAITDNNWHMITATYDGSYAVGLKIYIDGDDVTTTYSTFTATRVWDYNQRFLMIGGMSDGNRISGSYNPSLYEFRGYIDEFAIWTTGFHNYPNVYPAGGQNAQLTQSDIDNLYNYGSGIEYEICGTGTTKSLLATVDYPDQYYDDYIASTACTYTYCVKALLDSYTPDLVTACSNDVTFNGSIVGTYPPSGLTGVLVSNCAIEFNWVNNSLYQSILLQNYGSWNTIATIAGNLETYTWTGTPTSNIFRVIGVINGIQYISDQAVCEVPPEVNSVTKKNSRCFGLNPQPGRIILTFDYLITAHTYTFNVYREDNTLYYSQSGMSYNATFFVDNVPPACYYIELLDEICDCTVQTTIYCVESQSPFNLSGVKRVFISEYKDDLDWNNWSTGDENYFINGYDLLKFQSVKIKQFTNANAWYSLPTAEDSNYTQKMAKVRQGFVFQDTLTLSFTPSTYAKWLATGTLLEKRWVIVFEDNNSTEEKPQWWVFGYQNEGAKIRMYSRKSDFNYYTVEFSANTGDKIITAIDYDDYVLPTIINS